MDPMASRVESTWSFLFAMPVVLDAGLASAPSTAARPCASCAPCRTTSPSSRWASLVAFAVFYLSIDRAVSVLLIGG